MKQKKPYHPEDDFPVDDEDEYDPDYAHDKPSQNTIKNMPCPHEEQLTQICQKATKIAKQIRQIEQKFKQAEKNRAKWQKQLEKAYSRAKARRNGTAGKKEGKPDAGQQFNPNPKRETNSTPAPGTTYIGGGKIETLAWTPEKRCIKNTQYTGQGKQEQIKWIPNKWQPK